MAESVTISKTPPDFKSMRYDFLREEGLKHIQNLAGKIWTDYNLSDPGISILEVLSYVITDLGYRANYPIRDIIAQDPDAPQVDIKNFYTARQIMPMHPVTFNDYRKLLIDTDVHDPSDTGAEYVGVKNAWIDISPVNEIPVYVNKSLNKLDYKPEIAGDAKLDINVLYNVLLELGSCDKFGDLNENTLEGAVILSAPTTPVDLSAFSGLQVKMKVEFPRWDDPGVDWNSIASIRSHIKKLTLIFPKLPKGYKLEGYGLFPDNSVWVSIIQSPGGPAMNTSFIEIEIDNKLYTGADSLIALYQAKVRKILQIIAAVRARLMANRNLCEDVFRISALKIEEIAVCADIELDTNADVEETLAKIYFEIGRFLAPTIYFYTIEEMYDKGKRTEEIFEGPALEHGFIDDNELLKAERRKVIHVSDLIQIIMDVPGVVAVKSIQIANMPEDNDDNIASQSVKWCLDLAFEYNYVPRLSTELSKITFYKQLLPYKANESEVDVLLKELEDAARPQKLESVELDLPVPEGEYKNIEEYVSTQDEFPLVYGIGPEGLPESASALRKAQAKQLKGFLMFFDQLLADYLSQLAHVKDLFSMNEARDAYGDFVIDKSYFSQSLVPSVTDVTDLLKYPVFYAENVQEMTEDLSLFERRRNKFLDHLMARFSEQFTDYVMIEYKLTGKKAPKELLEDKLEFLNAYPDISSGRFKAFDYESPCELWSVNNASGLEKRVDLLSGVDPRTAADLHFHANFVMTATAPTLGFNITGALSAVVLRNASVYETVDDWKLGMEKVLINGVNRERYQVIDANGDVVSPELLSPLAPYTFRLVCGSSNVLGLSPVSTTYPTLSAAETAIAAAISRIAKEFYGNIESNRNNLSCPIENYIAVSPVSPYPNMVPDPPGYTFDFTLYKEPFDFSGSNVQLMTGQYTGYGEAKIPEAITAILASNEFKVSGDLTGQVSPGDKISIKNSDDNDGDYEVVSATAVPVGLNFETHIVITGTTPVPDLLPNIPFGTFYYNPQTESQLAQIADENTPTVLFEIMINGTKENHYTYDSLSGDYRFNIGDRCGATLATSVEENFNAAMAGFTANHPGGSRLVPPLTAPDEFRLSDNPVLSNNSDYAVLSADAIEDKVKVNIGASLIASSGGSLTFDGSFPITSANRFTRTFTMNGVLHRFLLPGEILNVYDSDLNDGSFTVKSVTTDGLVSHVRVEEDIHDDAGVLGVLYYLKKFDITDIQPVTGGTDIYFKPGVEVVAVREMVDFINQKFFGHEGMHIVEHVLLRPKVYEELLMPMTLGVNTLQTGLTPQGKIQVTKTFEIDSVNLTYNMFYISEDINTELSPMMFIVVKGSTLGINDRRYQVVSFGTTTGTDTGIKVVEPIPDNTLPENGNIYFEKVYPILDASTTDFTVTAEGLLSSEVYINGSAIITGSQNGANDHSYRISAISADSGNTVLTFNEVYTHYQDDLLPVNLKDDCVNCRLEDPYSFIASVVVPYWQGRFINQDFRGFFERTLRTECPAHIALNICWVSPEHMREFELKYKLWLLENSKKVKDKVALSAALNALIDILGRLRTVYPGGTLHDCESEDTLANSVILNRTALGTIQI